MGEPANQFFGLHIQHTLRCGEDDPDEGQKQKWGVKNSTQKMLLMDLDLATMDDMMLHVHFRFEMKIAGVFLGVMGEADIADIDIEQVSKEPHAFRRRTRS